jgi:GNAT superfamily N-acetyltransferase
MSFDHTSISYEEGQPGDEGRIAGLVEEVFSEFVAPQFSREGIAEFLKYIRVEAFVERIRAGNLILLAKYRNEIIGVTEIFESNHIALFFVDKASQRKGIGKELLRRTIHVCKNQKPETDRITVNSSPNAVAAYQKLGFDIVEKEQVKNGIRFIRMELSLT